MVGRESGAGVEAVFGDDDLQLEPEVERSGAVEAGVGAVGVVPHLPPVGACVTPVSGLDEGAAFRARAGSAGAAGAGAVSAGDVTAVGTEPPAAETRGEQRARAPRAHQVIGIGTQVPFAMHNSVSDAAPAGRQGESTGAGQGQRQGQGKQGATGAPDRTLELRSGGQAWTGVFTLIGRLAVVATRTLDGPQDAVGHGQAGAGLGFEIVDAGFGDCLVVLV